MANLLITIFEWLSNYFAGFSGYLTTVIITVAIVFWGDDIFAFLEMTYARLIKPSYRRNAPKMLRKAEYIDSFAVFLVGALFVVPAIQGLLDYFIRPILRTTSVIVLFLIIFVGFYYYYIKKFRPRILKGHY